jgi:HEAT repeat protein
MNAKFRRFLIGSIALGLGSSAALSQAADSAASTHAGRANVYRSLSNDSLEAVSTPEAILSYTDPKVIASSAPTKLWSLLEHGEKVECLDCIPNVSKMLFNTNAKTREISAWWLRRRIFGVFGPGQVYEQVLGTLDDASQPEAQRVYAANAIGEFLVGAGIAHVATALTSDASPAVRAASAAALQRLNNQGPNGELAVGLSDPDESVRLTALKAVTRINVFSGVDALVARISDPSAAVRRGVAQALGAMKAGDAVVGLIALTSSNAEADAGVRAAAVWALGQIADPAARDAVMAAESDADRNVRNAASMALARL